MTEVSATRLYVGNLPEDVTRKDVENYFMTHGTGEIVEVKLFLFPKDDKKKNYGFIEYKDAMDARDVVPAFHGTNFDGSRITVQFARGSRPKDNDRGPRPRHTPYRMQIIGLLNDTSWQDLKDFARNSGCNVVFSETSRDGQGRGYVEYETEADLKMAIEKLDGREFPPGNRVNCVVDTDTGASIAASTRSPDWMGPSSRRFQPHPDMRSGRSRSRSPRRLPYPLPPDDYEYDNRGRGAEQRPVRGYNPQPHDYFDKYRARSPRGRAYDQARYRFPPHGRYNDDPYRRDEEDPYRRDPYRRDDDPYRRDYPPRPDPSYANGRPYDRPHRPMQARDAGYHREGYPRDYDRGGRY